MGMMSLTVKLGLNNNASRRHNSCHPRSSPHNRPAEPLSSPTLLSRHNRPRPRHRHQDVTQELQRVMETTSPTDRPEPGNNPSRRHNSMGSPQPGKRQLRPRFTCQRSAKLIRNANNASLIFNVRRPSQETQLLNTTSECVI